MGHYRALHETSQKLAAFLETLTRPRAAPQVVRELAVIDGELYATLPWSMPTTWQSWERSRPGLSSFGGRHCPIFVAAYQGVPCISSGSGWPRPIPCQSQGSANSSRRYSGTSAAEVPPWANCGSSQRPGSGQPDHSGRPQAPPHAAVPMSRSLCSGPAPSPHPQPTTHVATWRTASNVDSNGSGQTRLRAGAWPPPALQIEYGHGGKRTPADIGCAVF